MKFKRVYLEIISTCNLHCSFCPTNLRPPTIMDPQKFATIIHQLRPLAQEVCLHLQGEPLMHPQLAQILEVCQTHQLPVQITTNGTLISRHQDLILSSPIIRQINFSLQSYLDNFPQADSTTYLQKIWQFCLAAQAQRPELYLNLRLWNQKHSQQLSAANETIFQFLETVFPGPISRAIDVASIKSKRLGPGRLYLHFDSTFEWPSLQNPWQGTTGTCYGMQNHFGILADGTVVPCCLDKDAQINLGNCCEQELIKILGSERAVAMAQGFQKGELVEKLCQHCSYLRRFNIARKTISP